MDEAIMYKIATSPQTHYISWYNPNNDYVFLTLFVNEFNIIYCLNHETIHQVLNKFINLVTSTQFDNIDSLRDNLWEFGL